MAIRLIHYRSGTSFVNTLPKSSASVLRVRLAKKASMKQAALSRDQNFKKTHKQLVLEQLKQAAPRVALKDLITSHHPTCNTWWPPSCARLVKSRAFTKCHFAGALLAKAELSKGTHL